MNNFDAEFLKSGFGLSLVGANSDGKSVSLSKPLVPVEVVQYEPTVPARPLHPKTDALENGK